MNAPNRSMIMVALLLGSTFSLTFAGMSSLAAHDLCAPEPGSEPTALDLLLDEQAHALDALVDEINGTVVSNVDGLDEDHPTAGQGDGAAERRIRALGQDNSEEQDWAIWMEPLLDEFNGRAPFDIDGDCVYDAWMISVTQQTSWDQGTDNHQDQKAFKTRTVIFQTDYFYGSSDAMLVNESSGDDGVSLVAYPKVIVVDPIDRRDLFSMSEADGDKPHTNFKPTRHDGRVDVTWADGTARATIYNVSSDRDDYRANANQPNQIKWEDEATPKFFIETDLVSVVDSGSALGALLGQIHPDSVTAPEPDPSLAGKSLVVGVLDPQYNTLPGTPFPLPYQFDRIQVLGFNDDGIPVSDLDADGQTDVSELRYTSNPLNRRSIPEDKDGDGFAASEEKYDDDPTKQFDFAPVVTFKPILAKATGEPYTGNELNGTAIIEFNTTTRASEPSVLLANLTLKEIAARFADAHCQLAGMAKPVEWTNSSGLNHTRFVIEVDTDLCADTFDQRAQERKERPMHLEALLLGDPGSEQQIEAGNYLQSPDWTDVTYTVANRLEITDIEISGGKSHDDDATFGKGAFSEEVYVDFRARDPDGDPTDPSVIDIVATLRTTRVDNRGRVFHTDYIRDEDMSDNVTRTGPGTYRLTIDGLWELANGTSATRPDEITDRAGYYLNLQFADATGNVHELSGRGSSEFALFHNDAPTLQEPVDHDDDPIPRAVVKATADDGKTSIVDFRIKRADKDIGQTHTVWVHYRNVTETEWAACEMVQYVHVSRHDPTTNEQIQQLTGQGEPPEFDHDAIKDQTHCEVAFTNSEVPVEYYFNVTDSSDELNTGWDGSPSSPHVIVPHAEPTLDDVRVKIQDRNPLGEQYTNQSVDWTVHLFDPAILEPSIIEDLEVELTVDYSNGTSETVSMAFVDGEALDGNYSASHEFDSQVNATEHDWTITATVGSVSSSITGTVAIDAQGNIQVFGSPVDGAMGIARQGFSAALDAADDVIGAGGKIPVKYWCAVNNALETNGETACTDTDGDGQDDGFETALGADPDNGYSTGDDKDADLVPDLVELVFQWDVWHIDADGQMHRKEGASFAVRGATPEGQRYDLVRVIEHADDQQMVELRFEHPTRTDSLTGERSSYSVYVGGAYVDPIIEQGADGNPRLIVHVRNVWDESQTLLTATVSPEHFGTEEPFVQLSWMEGSGKRDDYVLDDSDQDDETVDVHSNELAAERNGEDLLVQILQPVLDEHNALYQMGHDQCPAKRNCGNLTGDDYTHVKLEYQSDGNLTYEVVVDENNEALAGNEASVGRVREEKGGVATPSAGFERPDSDQVLLYVDVDRDGERELELLLPPDGLPEVEPSTLQCQAAEAINSSLGAPYAGWCDSEGVYHEPDGDEIDPDDLPTGPELVCGVIKAVNDTVGAGRAGSCSPSNDYQPPIDGGSLTCEGGSNSDSVLGKLVNPDCDDQNTGEELQNGCDPTAEDTPDDCSGSPLGPAQQYMSCFSVEGLPFPHPGDLDCDDRSNGEELQGDPDAIADPKK